MTLKPEIHTLIIWSKARDQKELIINELNHQFELVKTLEFNWSKDDFLNNLFPFYAHSQQHRNYQDYQNILVNKIEHCGNDPFFLFVFRDNQPEYDYRMTSSGERRVNTNIFDLKAKLRTLTDGGHKIHASDNTFESNKDLTILLGKNTEDFLKSAADYKDGQIISQNCTGVNGFKNIYQFFYLLNNSIDYIVMRNFECLPDEYTLEGHGDIDLLVENLNYIVYLTGAKAVFPNDQFRVHYNLSIGGEEIPFDFRFTGDNYYDRKWQERMLRDKVYFNQIIPVPDPKNYFYALLYHAFVQKYEIKDDYYPKMETLAQQTGIAYNRSQPKEKVKEILDVFFEKRQYRYTVPNDPSVIFNTGFTSLNPKPNPYGKILSSQTARFENDSLSTEVYFNSEKNCIFKICPETIAANEERGLKRLEGKGIAPLLKSISKKQEFSVLEIEFLEGVSMSELHKDGNFWTMKNIEKLIKDSISILEILIATGIQHRDIKPDNFLVAKNGGEYQLKIIDFGWAVDYKETNPLTPFYLGGRWKYSEGRFSDPYSLGKTLKEIFGIFPSICKRIDDSLLKFTPEDNPELNTKFKGIENHFDGIELTTKEKIKLFLKKNPELDSLIRKIYIKIRSL